MITRSQLRQLVVHRARALVQLLSTRAHMAAALLQLLLVAVLPRLAQSRPTQYEVHSLPGWQGPLVSRTYCGFGSAGTPPSGVGEMFFNYIFLESERDPENDPVVVWYNVGPGAASMFGLFVEIGPCAPSFGLAGRPTECLPAICLLSACLCDCHQAAESRAGGEWI